MPSCQVVNMPGRPQMKNNHLAMAKHGIITVLWSQEDCSNSTQPGLQHEPCLSLKKKKSHRHTSNFIYRTYFMDTEHEHQLTWSDRLGPFLFSLLFARSHCGALAGHELKRPPASDSQVMRLKVCATTCGFLAHEIQAGLQFARYPKMTLDFWSFSSDLQAG